MTKVLANESKAPFGCNRQFIYKPDTILVLFAHSIFSSTPYVDNSIPLILNRQLL